jgi:hypothetical protein
VTWRDANPKPARYAAFDAVKVLDTPVLHEVLARGDAAERVWAAWALGLRLGKGFVPETTSEPDAGVRAQLVVMLAGANELGAVRAMADGDEDADVRATACAYVHRLDAGGTDDASLLTHRFRSDVSWIVRRRLVELHAVRAFLTTDDVVQGLGDVDVSVRRATFVAAGDDEFSRLVDKTWKRYTNPDREPDRELRTNYIDRLTRLEGLAGALQRIEQQGEPSAETWSRLLKSGSKANWDAVAFLADGTPANESRLVDLLQVGTDERALRWLARSLLKPSAIWRDAIGLLASLPPEATAALTTAVAGFQSGERTLMRSRISEYRDEVRSSMDLDEMDEEEGKEWLNAVDALTKTMS